MPARADENEVVLNMNSGRQAIVISDEDILNAEKNEGSVNGEFYTLVGV